MYEAALVLGGVCLACLTYLNLRIRAVEIVRLSAAAGPPLSRPGSAAGCARRHPGDGAPLLLFEHVSKWYGPVIGVNQVTLELRAGITGLVGANGAGKSTLLQLATGQLRPDLGRVQVLGRDAWGPAAKRHVGYCPERMPFTRKCRAGSSSRRWPGCAAMRGGGTPSHR